jgi:hypothetical protein
MLTIQDQQVARQLRRIAEAENRPVDDVLKSLLAQYRMDTPAPKTSEVDEGVRRVRQHAYAEARKYWQEHGDTERLSLTDEELDEQFWLFDSEGIPRLKSEQDKVQLRKGTLYALAQEAKKARIQFSQTDPYPDYDEILNTEFADYLIQRMRGDHDEKPSSS